MNLPDDYEQPEGLSDELQSYQEQLSKVINDQIKELCNRQMKMLCEREEEIYREVMRQYMPPELFAKIRQSPPDPDVARWIQDNGWHFQIMPVHFTSKFVGFYPTNVEKFTCKEVRRGEEVIARHYFVTKAQ